MKYKDGEILTLDGQEFKPMVLAALSWLKRHQEAINTLNVFPVPDGDTGTNMTLTMVSAWNEVAGLDEGHIGRLANGVAHGALMGARGNSGVILSQIWRGFASTIAPKYRINAEDLAQAMRSASDTAYKGVVKPVEGTVLTVIREVAEEAEAAVQETQDLLVVFERMVQRAKVAESRTPELLPVLRQAGVVDSGGQGLVVILEGMWRHLVGLPVEDGDRLTRVMDLETAHKHFNTEGELEFDRNYPYDVQFIISGSDLNVPEIRATIEAMGDCPLVVGDESTVKVHVHVPDPGVPISYGAKCGSLRDVVVEDMLAQYQEFLAGRDEHPVLGPSTEAVLATLPDEPKNIEVVTVVAGDGLAKVYRSLGATEIIEGGQTMNPSTAQIVDAIRRTTAERVIVLPNNKNILMAAQQAAAVVEDKQVAVVPTRSIPQGISALLVLDQQATLDGNVTMMLQAVNGVITGEVTTATRDVELDGVEVHTGDAIGLLDGKLVVAADSFGEVARWLLAEADLEDRELVTLYYGADVTESQAQALSDRLAQDYPDLEFEIVYGGQPHYPFIISIE